MTETSEYDRRNMRAHSKRVSDNGLLKLLNDADRLAALERDLLDDVGKDRSQDTDWLRAGFLQRGAEIEQLRDGIRALAETIEHEAEEAQKHWRNGASAHYEGRADQASDDADRLHALLREDGQ